jgi:DNA invertase Pin-like site-specific DNA recombinase
LIFNIFASLAQFERGLIQERTHAGLKSARARGRIGGRPTVSPTQPTVRMAKKMSQDQSMSARQLSNH